MRITLLCLSVVTVASVVLGASPADARTLEVPDGYATIQDAVDAATPGDDILIQCGSYRESITLDGKSNLQIRGEGPDICVTLVPLLDFGLEVQYCEEVSIEGIAVDSGMVGVLAFSNRGLHLESMAFSGQYWALDSAANFGISVTGSEFAYSQVGINSLLDFADPDGDRPALDLKGNHFYRNWVSIYIDSSDHSVVQENEVIESENIGLGINVWDHHEVLENLFTGGAVGLFLVEYDDEFGPPDMTGPSRSDQSPAPSSSITAGTPVLVANNLFVESSVAGLYGWYPPRNASVFEIRNNIYYANLGAAIHGDSGSPDDEFSWASQLMISYNTFFLNGMDFSGGVTNPPRNTRNLYRDPEFVDPLVGDYHLSDGSSSIDTGTLDQDGDGEPDLEQTDYEGRSRDRGVFERAKKTTAFCCRRTGFPDAPGPGRL